MARETYSQLVSRLTTAVKYVRLSWEHAEPAEMVDDTEHAVWMGLYCMNEGGEGRPVYTQRSHDADGGVGCLWWYGGEWCLSNNKSNIGTGARGMRLVSNALVIEAPPIPLLPLTNRNSQHFLAGRRGCVGSLER